MLTNLDTNSFINCLRRFIARRGNPKSLYCDNGTNFVGAHSELRSLYSVVSDKNIEAFCLSREIDWYFNPPAASHFGGAWERMIRTVRKVLAGLLIKQDRLNDEILSTVFCEIENIVNGRPITKNPESVHDLGALSPNHLLRLCNSSVLLPGAFSERDKYRSRWKYVQFLANQFWCVWIQRYMVELQKRDKWNNLKRNLKVDDLVLIMDENVPRSLWPLGRIVDVKLSEDGLVFCASEN